MTRQAYDQDIESESDLDLDDDEQYCEEQDSEDTYAGSSSDPLTPGSKFLSREETVRLCRLASQGDTEARETIILSNLGYVKYIASQYVGHGVPFEDLYQEGCYGLIRAIDRYEYQPGATFQTYAWSHITKYIKMALQQQNSESPIIVSPEYTQLMQKYVKTHRQLLHQLGRVPTVTEMAQKMNLSMRKVNRLRATFFSFLSLDDKCTTNSHSASNPRLLNELVSSTPGVPRPTEDEALSLLGAQFDLLQTTLTPHEFEILSMKIGLDGYNDPMTFRSIAAHFSVSESTIRRRWGKLIKKLRQALQ